MTPKQPLLVLGALLPSLALIGCLSSPDLTEARLGQNKLADGENPEFPENTTLVKNITDTGPDDEGAFATNTSGIAFWIKFVWYRLADSVLIYSDGTGACGTDESCEEGSGFWSKGPPCSTDADCGASVGGLRCIQGYCQGKHVDFLAYRDWWGPNDPEINRNVLEHGDDGYTWANIPLLLGQNGIARDGFSMFWLPNTGADALTGNRVATYHHGDGTPYNFYHWGWHNTKVTLQWIQSLYPNPRRVVLVGTSSSGLGWACHAQNVRNLWPHSEIYVMNDSGVMLDARYSPDVVTWGEQWGAYLDCSKSPKPAQCSPNDNSIHITCPIDNLQPNGLWSPAKIARHNADHVASTGGVATGSYCWSDWDCPSGSRCQGNGWWYGSCYTVSARFADIMNKNDGVMSFFGGYLGAFGVPGAPPDADLWSVREAEANAFTEEVIGTRHGDITSTNPNYHVYYFDDPNTFVHTVSATCLDPNEGLPCAVSGSWFDTLTLNGVALSDWVATFMKLASKTWANQVPPGYPYE
jgi:hypothetical protein